MDAFLQHCVWHLYLDWPRHKLQQWHQWLIMSDQQVQPSLLCRLQQPCRHYVQMTCPALRLQQRRQQQRQYCSLNEWLCEQVCICWGHGIPLLSEGGTIKHRWLRKA
jgi:hypothetical protein